MWRVSVFQSGTSPGEQIVVLTITNVESSVFQGGTSPGEQIVVLTISNVESTNYDFKYTIEADNDYDPKISKEIYLYEGKYSVPSTYL